MKPEDAIDAQALEHATLADLSRTSRGLLRRLEHHQDAASKSVGIACHPVACSQGHGHVPVMPYRIRNEKELVAAIKSGDCRYVIGGQILSEITEDDLP